jgi:hypothetical protein
MTNPFGLDLSAMHMPMPSPGGGMSLGGRPNA